MRATASQGQQVRLSRHRDGIVVQHETPPAEEERQRGGGGKETVGDSLSI
ncbi:MAG: hypothetical protein GDA41_07845 [Rhodospirillales bacterium]|nr:hypothetical protein [Rhodospirillales bacterium]